MHLSDARNVLKQRVVRSGPNPNLIVKTNVSVSLELTISATTKKV